MREAVWAHKKLSRLGEREKESVCVCERKGKKENMLGLEMLPGLEVYEIWISRNHLLIFGVYM